MKTEKSKAESVQKAAQDNKKTNSMHERNKLVHKYGHTTKAATKSGPYSVCEH